MPAAVQSRGYLPLLRRILDTVKVVRSASGSDGALVSASAALVT
jgi:hypothetical protein